MATKCESVYKQDLDLQGDIRITLSAEDCLKACRTDACLVGSY